MSVLIFDNKAIEETLAFIVHCLASLAFHVTIFPAGIPGPNGTKLI